MARASCTLMRLSKSSFYYVGLLRDLSFYCAKQLVYSTYSTKTPDLSHSAVVHVDTGKGRPVK